MKTKIKYIFIAWALISTISCSDFLNTVPTDFSTVNNYYKTAAEYRSGAWGVYDILTDIFTENYINVISGSTDEMYHNYTIATNDIRVLAHNSNSSPVITLWNNLYSGILRANAVIAIPEKPIDMDTTDYKNRLAEVRFLRGYFYYMLVANFGDVPLMTMAPNSPENIQIKRTAKELVYAQILDDMYFAAENAILQSGLPPIAMDKKTGGGARITQTAVWGCLARVCLQMAGEPVKDISKYAEAKMWAQKVYDYYNDNTLDLLIDYSQIFKDLASDKYNRNECMWEIEYYGDGISSTSKTGTIGTNYGPSNSGTGKCFGIGSTNWKMTPGSGLYETADVRQTWCNANFYYGANFSVTARANWLDNYPGKFRREWESGTLPLYSSIINFPVIRYSDVLLMLAEAENEVNGPTQLAHYVLNKVRKRAKATSIAGITDKNEFRQIIQDERLRELCFEGVRRLDLIRWGIYVSKVKEAVAQNEEHLTIGMTTFVKPAVSNLKSIEPKHVLLPIPLTEINLNTFMVQNLGF